MDGKISFIARYIAVCILGLIIVVGTLIMIFEEQMLMRITGAICAVIAVVLGNLLWPRKERTKNKITPEDQS